MLESPTDPSSRFEVCPALVGGAFPISRKIHFSPLHQTAAFSTIS